MKVTSHKLLILLSNFVAFPCKMKGEFDIISIAVVHVLSVHNTIILLLRYTRTSLIVSQNSQECETQSILNKTILKTSLNNSSQSPKNGFYPQHNPQWRQYMYGQVVSAWNTCNYCNLNPCPNSLLNLFSVALSLTPWPH